MDTNICDIRYGRMISPWEESRWLVLSSCSFLFPSIYAYHNSCYSLCALLVITSAVSANYWRDARFSIRRDIDLVVSKIAFTTFVYNGIIHIECPVYVITGYPLLLILIYCYYLSNCRIHIPSGQWYMYHSAFHYIMMYEQFIILHSIVSNNKIH
jgi:hypothetical protein